MALKHHWKFNGNLQDAVGDLHLTNVVGTPAYTSNKDGVANSCVDNSTKWYAYSNNTVELSDSQRSYSFWMENPSDIYPLRCYIYQDKMFMFYVREDQSRDTISLACRYNINWYPGHVLSVSFLGVTEDWIHVCITINNVGVKKIFINGILKGTVTNTIAPVDDVSLSGVLINGFRDAYSLSGENRKNVDEIKYFDHILTDGGVTTVGQAVSVNSEVWLLYLDGVNNRPRYTLNEATNVTATTATVSWTK